MSQAQCVYGTFICLGGQLIAESQAADTARFSIADATLVASIAQAGRVFGESRGHEVMGEQCDKGH